MFKGRFRYIHFILSVCARPIDIAFIVDASAKVDRKNFLYIRNFLKQIVSSFSVSASITRFGMVEFSTNPRKLFDFNRFTNQATLVNVLGRVPYMGGAPMAGKALKYAAATLFARTTRPKVAIVISSGKSLDSVMAPARMLRRAGVTLIAVGLGQSFSVTQLRQMATTRRHVFASHFKTANNIVRSIKEKACKGTSHLYLEQNFKLCSNTANFNCIWQTFSFE